MNQHLTPLASALFKESHSLTISFDVPGHKGTSDCLRSFFGQRCLNLDKNSRSTIDNLISPSSVIKQAELLAAEAFNAKYAFFMVGGTTSCIQSMIMSICKPGDSIILPRNVHASILNGIILAGAIPLYLRPEISDKFGISLGVTINEVERVILENPQAKAILLNNPTYYGICSDLKRITEIAHQYGLKVLVDEAHGSHFYFNKRLPVSAMHCGADMSAVSMHKTGGSLTQSSLLLIGNDVDVDYVKEIINLSLTTSSSYLLTASLDIARSFMATKGAPLLDNLINRVNEVRKKINNYTCFCAFNKNNLPFESVYAYDSTKLSINTSNSGYAGIEIYNDLLRKNHIQLEFGDISNILALPTIFQPKKDLNILLKALAKIKISTPHSSLVKFEYLHPIVKTSPREAFFSKKTVVPIEESEDMICGEFIMCYPPGVPILAPGELITRQAIELIQYSSQKGCNLTGISDPSVKSIKVIK